eukprot:1133966-Pelagomonas_calceolata.AAC.1
MYGFAGGRRGSVLVGGEHWEGCAGRCRKWHRFTYAAAFLLMFCLELWLTIINKIQLKWVRLLAWLDFGKISLHGPGGQKEK